MHWTISRLKDYELCPKRYEYKYLLQHPEPGPKSPALARGILLHESIEHYLDGSAQEMLAAITPSWQNMVRRLKDRAAEPEQQWEFDAEWYPYDGAAPLWLRMKLDANYEVSPTVHAVIDFKTGQHYPSNVEQLEVYALGAFALFDEVEEVQTALWYLDGEEPLERTIKRTQTKKLARKWEGRAARLLTATEFGAVPGRHCRWCPFRAVCPEAA